MLVGRRPASASSRVWQRTFRSPETTCKTSRARATAPISAALKVSISPQEIVSNIGVCTILDNKQDGDSFKLHVECKFPAGPLVGDLTFTPLPDQTIKFVDRDNTYNGDPAPLPELSAEAQIRGDCAAFIAAPLCQRTAVAAPLLCYQWPRQG